MIEVDAKQLECNYLIGRTLFTTSPKKVSSGVLFRTLPPSSRVARSFAAKSS